VSLTFLAGGQLAFTGRQDVLTECPYKKNVPLNGQTKKSGPGESTVNVKADGP